MLTSIQADEFADCDAWRSTLEKLLKETQMPKSLEDALKCLFEVTSVDSEKLMFTLESKRKDMAAKLKAENLEIPVDFSLMIYAYTLDDPSIYKAINSMMFSPERSEADGKPSAKFLKIVPLIKYLDVAFY